MSEAHRRRVAYVILAHSSSDNLSGLMTSIYNRHDLFLVHLDAKAPQETKCFLTALSNRHGNIATVPSIVCSWGSFSLVDAALRAIALALTSSTAWSHLLLLSEQHYPLVHSADIAARLEEDVSYLGAHAYVTFYPPGQRDIAHRFSRRFREVEGVGSFFHAPRAEDLSHVYHGAQWLILSKRAAAYVSAQFRIEAVRAFFASSLLPDETAFPTILMNGPEEERGGLRLAETTFVAWPHRTDNGAMIASRPTFEDARISDALFIRKRPPTMEGLEEFEIVGETLSPDRPPTYPERARALWHRATGSIFDRARREAADTLDRRTVDAIDFLTRHLDGFDLSDHRDAQPSTTLYLSARHPHWLSGLRVHVLSYNLSDYAVVLVAEPTAPLGDSPFDERWIGGFPTHKIKVRITGLFLSDQIECPLAGSGIVHVADPGEPREVVDLVLEAARHADGIPA